MQIQTRAITLLDFAKLAIYGIFLNYYCINILRGNLLPYGTLVFYLISGACVFASILGDQISVSKEIICWIAYVCFSLITLGFALDSSRALKGIGEFIQRLILIIMIAYICEKEKSTNFALRVLAVTAYSCALSSLLMSEDVSKKLTVVSGARISTNDIGALMAFGCFGVLFAFGMRGKTSFFKIVIKIGYILVAVSVIFIAGSRKSILAVFLLFGLLFLLCGRDYFKNISLLQFAFLIILIIGAIVFAYYYLLPHVEETDMYQSVFGRRVDDKAQSDAGRIELYEYAIREFIHSPLVGLGYNCFSAKYVGYTHSTYVEPLACSGVGGLLYLIPYVMIFIKQIKLISLNKHNQQERLWQKELLVFCFVFLFVGIGIPYMYKDIPCIILAMFIASQRISFDRLSQADECIHDQ